MYVATKFIGRHPQLRYSQSNDYCSDTPKPTHVYETLVAATFAAATFAFRMRRQLLYVRRKGSLAGRGAFFEHT